MTLCDVALALAIGWLLYKQRRLVSELRLTRETAEDLGWNWERDDTYR